MHTNTGHDAGCQGLDDCPVYILAGGQSRRMEWPKALLPFPDVPLLLVLVDRLRVASRCVYVVCSPVGFSAASDAVQITLSDYCFNGNVLVDPIPNGGPLGGVACAVEHTRQLGRPRCLVIPCDMPFLTTTFLARLASTHRTAPAVIPLTADGKPTGVCAAYNVAILPALSAFLRQGGRRVRDFLQTIPAVPLPFPDYADLPGADRLLYNLNTPADYRQALLWHQEARLENSLSDDSYGQPRQQFPKIRLDHQ
ncbi:molybdenum cofactor guanylyltransferase [Chloracidobacterium aggregatum]|uniref:molybdenum cofactor guanylyltransferase n=1 Tax=Chloracidobacterium aggregatum TaxID=2851959 RepID=UPI002484860E|nr:molybdenum cofactor guanylyltransferase [Chloracidobacterium aggregatum]